MKKGEKFKKVLLAIGIAIALAAFAGFFAWEMSDSLTKDQGKTRDCWNECKVSNDAYETCTQTCYGKNLPSSNCQLECKTQYDAYRACADPCEAYNQGIYQARDNARDQRMKIFSITTLIIGAIAIVAGVLLGGASAVSGGLIAGGLITLVEAIVSYWSQMQGWLRVLSLGVILALLIFIGLKKLKDR